MTKEARLFAEDVREKKLIARSARNKNRRCKVPNINNYTDRELKARNGTIHVCKLNAPMEYAHFQKLSPGIQVEYIQRHRADPKTVGVMLGISPHCAANVIQNLKIPCGFRRFI